MEIKEFKDRLVGKVYSIEIIDNSHSEDTSEPDSDDSWDRADTSTSHNIVGFRAGPESEGKYYDLVVPFEPKFDTTYYVLYAIYSTGDSFGHDDGSGSEFIGFYTKDELDVAHENMSRIESHKQVDDEKWSIKLRTPNGSKTFDQSTPWVGYFEHLDYVDIASIERQK